MTTPFLQESWHKIEQLLSLQDEEINMACSLLEAYDEPWLFSQASKLIRIEEVPLFEEKNLTRSNRCNIRFFWREKEVSIGTLSQGLCNLFELLKETNHLDTPNVKHLYVLQPNNFLFSFLLTNFSETEELYLRLNSSQGEILAGIGEYTKLTKFKLRVTSWTTFVCDADFSKLVNLKILLLTGNIHISKGFCESLPQLEVLSVNLNRTDRYREFSLAKQQILTTLRLGVAAPTELAYEIEELKQLKSLTIPFSFPQITLESLSVLRLKGPCSDLLNDLNKRIFPPNSEEIYINGPSNFYSASQKLIPRSLLNCSKLKKLFLINCRIQVVDRALLCLQELEELNISGNPINFFDPHILQLPKLKKVKMFNLNVRLPTLPNDPRIQFASTVQWQQLQNAISLIAKN